MDASTAALAQDMTFKPEQGAKRVAAGDKTAIPPRRDLKLDPLVEIRLMPGGQFSGWTRCR